MKAKAKTASAKRVFVAPILPEIRSLIEAARSYAISSANLALVQLYWNIGRLIIEDIQGHSTRAEIYGEQLLERLAKVLTRDYGQGFSVRNLRDMQRFHSQFEIRQAAPAESFSQKKLALPRKNSSQNIRQALPAESFERIIIDFREHHFLSWTHYRILLGIADPLEQKFYFDQVAMNRWSTRELEKRMSGALFERVALSRDTRKLVALEKRKGPGEIAHYSQIFKDPYLLDFLGLTGAYSEKDLESALIQNLEQFLSELGNDFCFIRRQYPMRLDSEDYWLDLLFFHRGLRCLVAVDLKLGAFSAQDKGQMDLYLAWLKQHEWRKGENEPVGLILCTSRRRQHVELLLGNGPHKMQVAQYLTKFPVKKIIRDRLKVYSRILRDSEPH